MSAPPNAPKFKLVYVEWEDHSGADGWMPLSAAKRDSGYIACSVGWLIAEHRERIMLAASITAASDEKIEPDVAGHMTINRALIKRMRTVRM